ncbi:unnamed protein product, partial [Mesorhabditis belari]|uniref:BTB domain-containing protein n=1 Tax=Mesorhabditis belari TaxID=2138241 RepID=A0AAF3F546_9BILA
MSATAASVKNRLPLVAHEPQGQDCFGDDRESMNDFAKYFNNSHLADVSILCGEESYPAHRLVLARGSDVFDRMLTDEWDGTKKIVQLIEEPQCVKVFAAFLRFLYCNHVLLHPDNTLPILILADKYNVPSLKKVCQDYAVNKILPNLSLKEIYTEWFSYATRAFHPPLIRACISAIGKEFETVISDDWAEEWESADVEQVDEILRHNSLVVNNEFQVWSAVLRWLNAPSHPQRREPAQATKLLSTLLPLIRFPFMSGEELVDVEMANIPETAKAVLMPHVYQAYKYQTLPLSRRVGAIEFTGCQFLLRCYSEVRWSARLILSRSDLERKPQGSQPEIISTSFFTRASAIQCEGWRWSLKIVGSAYSGDETKRVILVAEDIDQSRVVDYLFAICDETKVLRSVSGRKNFSKTRDSVELALKHKDGDLPFHEVIRESSLFVNGRELHVQLMLKPAD